MCAWTVAFTGAMSIEGDDTNHARLRVSFVEGAAEAPSSRHDACARRP